MQNSIGTSEFTILKGQVVPPSERLESHERPGVNGTGFWKLGTAGHPFVLRSIVDCASLADAEHTFSDYLSHKGDAVLTLIKDGMDYSAHVTPAWGVKVVDVRQVELTARGAIVGGLNVTDGNDGYVLVCEWSLVAMLMTLT